MKRVLVVAAALALTACGDGGGNPVSAGGAAPLLATGPSGPKYTIFTTQQPASFVTGTSAWEVATRFKVSEPGRIVGLRFWRAPGETGTNRGRLWTDAGVQLKGSSYPHSGRAGWDTVMFSTAQRIAANTYFRVSVNTNVWQAKTFNGAPSPIVNGPVTADLSYYGQPAGSMPTTSSYSWFFVDVIFIPDGPLPNLYVHSIQRGLNANGEEAVAIRICNNGPATAPASTTKMEHWADLIYDGQFLATPSLAPGACALLTPEVYPGGEGSIHAYYIYADHNDVVYESNEDDNRGQLE